MNLPEWIIRKIMINRSIDEAVDYIVLKLKNKGLISIYKTGTISYGPGYEEDKKLILEIRNVEPKDLFALIDSLEPEYIETISSKRGRIGLKVENNSPYNRQQKRRSVPFRK